MPATTRRPMTLTVLALCVVMSASLAGCGGEEPAPDSGSGPVADSAEHIVERIQGLPGVTDVSAGERGVDVASDLPDGVEIDRTFVHVSDGVVDYSELQLDDESPTDFDELAAPLEPAMSTLLGLLLADGGRFVVQVGAELLIGLESGLPTAPSSHGDPQGSQWAADLANA